MKIKLCIVVSIIAIFAVILSLSFPKPQPSYSGTYYAYSTNEKLVLNSNNTFKFNSTSYNNSITIRGKYRISNNHIELQANNKNDTSYIRNILSGEVNGSLISFKQANNRSSIIFTKS